MNNGTKQRILDAISKVGVLVDNSADNDIDLRNYIEDSVMFISSIIEIEDEFGIDLPDELFLLDNFSLIGKLSNIIEDLLVEKSNIK